jgi:hypothetical protein
MGQPAAHRPPTPVHAGELRRLPAAAHPAGLLRRTGRERLDGFARPPRARRPGLRKYGAGCSLFEDIYQGADAQQAFKVRFSAFQQEHVPANYTAIA